MQNRYAGDLGDYLKFGLLRQLCAGDDSSPGLKLGVVWYLVKDESHNDDGKHIAYLREEYAGAKAFRSLDPDLYDRLAVVVRSAQRSTAALVAAGVLPVGAKTYSEPLDFGQVLSGGSAGRLRYREAWLQGALAATSRCDLIFADPDNGIRKVSHGVARTRTKAVKHAYLDELAAFAARGQSLVIYHHADRSAPVVEQARRRLAELAQEIAGVQPIAAVRASRGTTRLFLVAAAPRHLHLLTARLNRLATGPWYQEFEVYWPEKDKREVPRS